MKYGMIALAIVVAHALCFLERELVYPIIGEEKLVEYGTAFMLIAAGVLAIRKTRSEGAWLDRRVRWMCYAFGALMLFGGLEEISWGQTILQFESPGAVESRNVQRETNLHNLEIWSGRDARGNPNRDVRALINANRAADAFAVLLLIALPLLHQRMRQPTEWLAFVDRRSLRLGALLALTLGLSLVCELALGQERWRHRAISEVREASYSVLFLAWTTRWRCTERNVSRSRGGRSA